MKRYLRYLALLLCLCVFSMSFSSCMTYFRIYDEFEQMVEEVLGETKTDETEREDPELRICERRQGVAEKIHKIKQHRKIQ